LGSFSNKSASPTGSILAAQPQVLERESRLGFWNIFFKDAMDFPFMGDST
jgi:hypothetical protein